MPRVIHMRGLAACAIQFNYGNIFSLLQFIPGIVTQIHPAKIKTIHLLADAINSLLQLFADQVAYINKLGPPA